MPGIGSSTTWPTAAGAPPLYATPRDPSRPSEGAQVAAVARSLATPLLPWQQHVADVATERRADGSYEYEVVVVSVPRQTGKTTLIRSVGVHRAGVQGRAVHYTAQTGKDARERWRDLVTMVQASSVWKGRTKPSLRGGAEVLTFHGNAGFHCFAPGKKALHGSTPPTVVLDEAFAHDAAMGAALMGAISPAQQTILAKQLWIVSTAGTAESTFLHEWIERGLTGAPRVALFLWAADEQTDPYTLEGIERFHPGVGFTLGEKVLTAADVLGEAEKNTRAEYERAFANRRTLTSTNLIGLDLWRAIGPQVGDRLEPPASRTDVHLAYDVSADRTSSSIVAAWPTSGGGIDFRVVRSAPGTSWLADAVDELDADWRPARVVAVGHGPVLDVTADLERRGVDVTVLAEREFATATGAFLTRLTDGTMRHHGADGDVLEKSATGLVTRAAATDGVAFSRRHSVGDSSPGIAATAATYSVERDRDQTAPVVRFSA